LTQTNIDYLPPIFYPSEKDIDGGLFQPVASVSTTLDCMVGYFTSGVLSELALALSSFLKIEDAEPMRFIISPNIESNDLAAIRQAYSEGTDFFGILFPELLISESALRTYTVSALAYLIVSKKIELKVALKRNGLFHTKAWLFKTPSGGVAIHGSSNATTGGMFKNFEQLVLSRSWMGWESNEVVKSLQKKFDTFWGGGTDDVEIIPMNDKTLETIARLSSKQTRVLENFSNSYYVSLEESGNNGLNNRVSKLSIPGYIDFRNGAFAHQGEAVDAWFENNQCGILSIATGGGKTITSMIAATKLMEREKSLLVVVAVPTKALMNQWERDISEFGVSAVNTNGMSVMKIQRACKSSARNLRLNLSSAEVIVVTHAALLNDIFDEKLLNSSHFKSMLIVDEVHNIGSQRSQEKFPRLFDFKIGLSATFERQFDEEGTRFLIEIFNKVVYEYGLDRAIGECLVNFQYYAHFIYLTAEEEFDFEELTAEIKKMSFAAASDAPLSAKERWQRLCLKRRALVESASNKIEALENLLPKSRYDIKKSLIFCTDKNPEQLDAVNEILVRRKVNFHQITAEETAQNKTLNSIIKSFSDDELQVLTSKRVLDEGFNVPQTETAYLLASNTVLRQWTQRLGRVLRSSPGTGKERATIHDFIVLPAVDGEADKDLKSLIESEYRRIQFFSGYSDNYTDKNGGYEACEKILQLLGAV
jgi:superfamily II DNA or RNA helicase